MSGRASSKALQRRGMFVATVAAMTTGCFALFELDGYGPAAPPDEAGVLDGATKDAAPRDAGPPPKVVFVTSQLFGVGDDGVSPDLTKVHERCNALARDAGLGGNFKAWISNEESTPAEEFAALTRDGGDELPLVTTTGVLIASSYAQLADSGPRVAIAVTERREPLIDAAAPTEDCEPPHVVWTATSSAGKREEVRDCFAWRTSSAQQTGRVGRLVAHPTAWTSACDLACSQRARLYCFEQ